MTTIAFRGETRTGTQHLAAAIDHLVIAGWTGRDAAAVEAHIAELERLGVKRPATTPIFYRVAAALLTTAPAIEVAGRDTSGEVEPVIFSIGGTLWVGVGSDHTDRKAETHGVTLAKQLCAKPVAPVVWPYAEVADHWDALVLRSFATRGGRRSSYQEGPVSALRPPAELIGKYMKGGDDLPGATALFCGTLAVPGGIAGADQFEIALEDPVLNRLVSHAYDTRVLPVAG